MRKKLPKILEDSRIDASKNFPFSADYTESNKDGLITGTFLLKTANAEFFIISSNIKGWDHISISKHYKGKMSKKLPTWSEMCYIKDLFFDKDELAIQFHPPESNYINLTEVLHLWRKQDNSISLPPKELV